MRRVLTLVSLLSLAAFVGAAQAAPVNSALGAPSTSPLQARAQAQSVLLLKAAVSPLVVTLAEPSADELAQVEQAPVAGAKLKPLPIGFGRDVPAALRDIELRSLDWQGTAEGGRAAQIVIVSPGAAALRLALQMQPTDPDVVIRLQGDDPQAQAMGPFAANEIAETTRKIGEWWSPILEGSRATIEISVSASVDVGSMKLTVSRISHLMRAGAALAPRSLTKATGVGTSGSCELDFTCAAPSTALTNASHAVGRMVFTQDNGSSYLCTGTLLVDTIRSNTPYFFTADHCIDSAYAAATLNVYWFFEATSCDTPKTVGPYQLQHGGSTLLGRSVAEDWSMVRLNQPAPAGTYLSGWNANPVSTGAVVDLHHPSGDLLKFSSGTLTGFAPVQIDGDDGEAQINATLARVTWNVGVTEGGSSGSGLLAYNASAGEYLVLGGLSGGASSCSEPTQPDFFSRLDQMMPKMRDYLAPGTSVPNTSIVVEYYNSGLDHYFMTQSPLEINDLDTGVFPGWERTGLRFLAYTAQVPGSSPVCRFYRAPGYGDSHFYSASPSECSVLINNPKYPGWIFESPNVFYIVQPDQTTGACAVGTHPLWRFFHTTVTNHRYTDDVSVRDNLRTDPDWVPEGYGPDAVIMCAPNGA